MSLVRFENTGVSLDEKFLCKFCTETFSIIGWE